MSRGFAGFGVRQKKSISSEMSAAEYDIEPVFDEVEEEGPCDMPMVMTKVRS